MFIPKDKHSVHLRLPQAPSKNGLNKLGLQQGRGRKPRFGRERPRCLCGFAAQKCSPGSLPPKSPIGIRQGPFGAKKKQKKFIFLEMFFGLLAH